MLTSDFCCKSAYLNSLIFAEAEFESFQSKRNPGNGLTQNWETRKTQTEAQVTSSRRQETSEIKNESFNFFFDRRGIIVKVKSKRLWYILPVVVDHPRVSVRIFQLRFVGGDGARHDAISVCSCRCSFICRCSFQDNFLKNFEESEGRFSRRTVVFTLE